MGFPGLPSGFIIYQGHPSISPKRTPMHWTLCYGASKGVEKSATVRGVYGGGPEISALEICPKSAARVRAIAGAMAWSESPVKRVLVLCFLWRTCDRLSTASYFESARSKLLFRRARGFFLQSRSSPVISRRHEVQSVHQRLQCAETSRASRLKRVCRCVVQVEDVHL